MSAYKLRLVSSHVREQWVRHTQALAAPSQSMLQRPLIVGMQGPQGSGKTTITTRLVQELSKESTLGDGRSVRPLNVAVFSIDDLYLPFEGLERVAKENADNRLLQGRGQPGTHDVTLGSRILEQLSQINQAPSGTPEQSTPTVQLPSFDKSLHDGRGDRSQHTLAVKAPLDVVIFEGWCLGFASLSDSDLVARHEGRGQRSPPKYSSTHKMEHLSTINDHLKAIEKAWYQYIDAFVQLVPTSAAQSPSSADGNSSLETVFEWRLQAEHAMKAQNGGRGMTDEQIHAFVERYMPGYELFGDGVTASQAPWKGRLLRIGLGPQREVTMEEQR